jgi:hypothetical protein
VGLLSSEELMPEKNPNNINQIEAPIDLAMKIFDEQQGRVLNTLTGSPKAERQQMVGDVPLEQILPSVMLGMEQQ